MCRHNKAQKIMAIIVPSGATVWYRTWRPFYWQELSLWIYYYSSYNIGKKEYQNNASRTLKAAKNEKRKSPMEIWQDRWANTNKVSWTKIGTKRPEKNFTLKLSTNILSLSGDSQVTKVFRGNRSLDRVFTAQSQQTQQNIYVHTGTIISEK